MSKKKEYDICIVGAGVAGSILAANLAKFNYRIIVIDKTFKGQEKIIGELLQPGGVQALREMKLDFLLNKIDAQKIRGYALFLKEENFTIPYNLKKPPVEGSFRVDIDPELTAISFKNSRFVTQARKFIKDFDLIDLVEGNVTQLIEKEDVVEGVKYTSKAEQKQIFVKAKMTIICEGQGSKLRKSTAKSNRKVSGYFVGMELKKCELPVPNHGHVILTGESPVLIYPISSTEKRILIDYPGSTPPVFNDDFFDYLGKVREGLPSKLLKPFDKAVKEGKFKSMPNQNLRAEPLKKQRVVLLGDSFNMRHPLTGGGMSAVFNDIINMVKSFTKYNDLDNSSQVEKIIKNYYQKRTKDVANINILADSLYHATSDPNLKLASFNYLKEKSHQKNTIQIIAGIDKKKYNLIQHFVMVTLNGINKLNLSHSKKLILLGKASKIILPLLVQEGDSRLHKWAQKLVQKFFVRQEKSLNKRDLSLNPLPSTHKSSKYK